MEELEETIKLVYIGDTTYFFKYGNRYTFSIYENEIECMHETGTYHIWSIKSAFQSFVSPDIYSRMIF